MKERETDVSREEGNQGVEGKLSLPVSSSGSLSLSPFFKFFKFLETEEKKRKS